MTPYEAVYGVLPPQLLSYMAGTTRVQAVQELLKSRDQIKTSKESLQAARGRMKRLADQHRTDREFVEGDWDWVYL